MDRPPSVVSILFDQLQFPQFAQQLGLVDGLGQVNVALALEGG
jgi:hypothetical protein